ncbi:MAG: phenylacetate-CoA oxygenase subunit PaaC [Flavisolibacter sp.]|jgi:ring-1,2-phenylacetyl-CoA epoxidase subunit PaaC|nr:phenylacetate-CoA oxygenase subunit PaaC [Flavisolibacter sp.]
MQKHLFTYLLHLADNALVLGQRNAEWTGHGPVLEQDIAITNISLDLIGQARHFYQYAAKGFNQMAAEEKTAADQLLPRIWKSYGRELEEDDLAMLRDEHQYRNLLITELPKGDWAFSILRQYFFSVFQFYQYEALQCSTDPDIAAIAEKSIKETAYHVRWSAEWVIRLGDGTNESHQRIRQALSELWMFTGEFFEASPFETSLASTGTGADPAAIKQKWMDAVSVVFSEAGLDIPVAPALQSGGKKGIHTEYMGYLLAEMQFLQRTYPNAQW